MLIFREEDMVPAVEAVGLTKDFPGKRAVDSVSFAVAPGEFFGFLGPNGAGKSTTIKMLVGLLRPTHGQACLNGVDVWQEPLRAKAQIGVMPEGLNLYDRLSAREFLRLVGALHHIPDDEVERRSASLLDLMDLTGDADKLVVDYSHGMRKKTALAAALIHAPPILFLDEPFEGIDAISGRAIRDALQRLRARGTTIFFSSHILEVVERLCTRVAVIAGGRLVAAEATLEELFLQAVGASGDETRQAREEQLAWLG
jgi:ABC-2 type transport system ATP-binding protein